ncbi:MAG: hypothetical protein K2X02_00020 [Alphaproteobacteria bacterium]|nr:hypothetical protein [Alphaproteobacteria bacterium]MCI5059104.1 hypothetical protein [Flavobacteriales bacterium]
MRKDESEVNSHREILKGNRIMIRKAAALLISSFICNGLLSNEGKCSGIMTKELLELLHQKSRKVQRKVTAIDWEGNKIFVQDKFKAKTGDTLLDNKDLDELKKKSFIPPLRNVVRMDLNEDIIYYEKHV